MCACCPSDAYGRASASRTSLRDELIAGGNGAEVCRMNRSFAGSTPVTEYLTPCHTIAIAPAPSVVAMASELTAAIEIVSG